MLLMLYDSDQLLRIHYDLFRQGHPPSSAHLEYETHLTYMDDSNLLADRNVNPKISDAYIICSTNGGNLI